MGPGGSEFSTKGRKEEGNKVLRKKTSAHGYDLIKPINCGAGVGGIELIREGKEKKPYLFFSFLPLVEKSL